MAVTKYVHRCVISRLLFGGKGVWVMIPLNHLIFPLDLFSLATTNTFVTGQDVYDIAIISQVVIGSYKVKVEINPAIVIKGEIADDVRSLNVIWISIEYR